MDNLLLLKLLLVITASKSATSADSQPLPQTTATSFSSSSDVRQRSETSATGSRRLTLASATAVAPLATTEVPRTIQLAALMPIADSQRPFSASKMRPAAELAVEYVQSIMTTRTNRQSRHQQQQRLQRKDGEDVDEGGSVFPTLTVAYRDSHCSEVNGMNEAINYYVYHRPGVYLGPVCDYAVAPVARQSLFWNIPVLSTGALALDFVERRRSVYPLLTRAGPVNLLGLADGLIEALRMWKWHRVTVLYERDAYSNVIPPFCHLTTETIIHRLQRTPADVIVAHDYYKLVEPSASSSRAGTGSSPPLEHVLVNEIGLKYAGWCLSACTCPSVRPPLYADSFIRKWFQSLHLLNEYVYFLICFMKCTFCPLLYRVIEVCNGFSAVAVFLA